MRKRPFSLADPLTVIQSWGRVPNGYDLFAFQNSQSLNRIC